MKLPLLGIASIFRLAMLWKNRRAWLDNRKVRGL
jgi:hypothetical protein